MRARLANVAAQPRTRGLLMLAALTFYSTLVLWFQPGKFVGDEWRYAWLADNLRHGYFSPPDFVFLWNGPGYPLLQAALSSLGLGMLGIRLFNALLLTVALAVFYKIVRGIASAAVATLLAVGAAAYLPVAAYVPFAYTEVLCFLLVTLFVRACQLQLADPRPIWVIAAGVTFGALVMTKVGFWPLLIVGCIGCGALWWQQRRRVFLQWTCSLLIALGCCLPYLVYTQQLTGRPWYWGSATGSVVYWMTHPYPEGHGDWLHQGEVQHVDFVREQHWALMNRLGKFDEKTPPDPQDVHAIAHYLSDISSPEAGDGFMTAALDNLRQHPSAYLRNWVFNVCRLLFDYPYTLQRFDALRAVQAACNALLLLGAALGIRRLWTGPTPQRPLGQLCLLLLVAYLGVMSLVSAVARYVVPVAPLALILGAMALAPRLERMLESSRSQTQRASNDSDVA